MNRKLGRPQGSKDKRNGLRSVREKKFVKAIVQTQEIGRSAVVSGYSDPSYGSKLMKNPRIATAIQEAMEKAGIDDSYLVKKVKEGLESTYPQKLSSNGQIIQNRDPDYFTRAIYLDKTFKVRGDYAPEKHETTEKKIVLVITPEFAKGLVDSGAISSKEAIELCKAELSERK